MGQAAGSQSRQRTKHSSEIVTEVLVSTIQNCGVSYSGSQRIRIYASKGTLTIKSGITQLQSAIVNITCLTDARTITNIQNDIIDKINKTANQLGEDGTAWLNAQRTSQNTIIENRVRNNITKEFVQNCASSIELTQAVDVSAEDGGNVVIEGDVSQFITAKIISNCSQKAVDNTTLGATFKSLDEQIAKQESSGIATGVSNFFSSTWYIWVILIIVAVAAGYIYFTYFGPGRAMRVANRV